MPNQHVPMQQYHRCNDAHNKAQWLWNSVLLLLVMGLLFLPMISHANDTRKSRSGICHEKGVSPYYNKTSPKQSYASVNECLASSKKARLPKGLTTSNIQQAQREATEQGREFSSVYNRKDWPHWSDKDRDCQDTRAEILIAQSSTPVKFNTSRKCRVTSGTWNDPYSGKIFYNDDDLDIDHISALAYAHARGGQSWSRAKKEAFANDPENLLAVKNSLNRQKGAKGMTEWMPPNQAYRCTYIKRFDHIMTKYQLTYFANEKRIINRMKKACGLN